MDDDGFDLCNADDEIELSDAEHSWLVTYGN